MSKTVDVDLRIRAKNLTKATLSEITADVDRLTKAQEGQAKASGLASRSMADLAEEADFLAKAQRELERRSALAGKYRDEAKAIGELQAKITELAAKRKQLAAGTSKEDALGLKGAEREIRTAERSLASLETKLQGTAARMANVGVSTDNVEQQLAEMASATQRTAQASARARADLERYNAALREHNAVLAEAARRNRAEANARSTAVDTNAGNRNRRVELDALRRDIEARSEVARQAGVQAEAQRRLAAAAAQESAARENLQRNLVAERNRRSELAQMRRDALAAFSAETTATNTQTAAQQRADARRSRLVALIQSERGQRVLAAEAARRQTATLDASTGAVTRNANATRKATNELKLFDDTGRESLGTYQRLRGQVLSLAAGYIGVFEAINTVKKSIDAVNRDQSLRAGLTTGAGGNAEVAAQQYAMLRKEADRLGLVFDDVAPRFVNLNIAGQAAGLTAQQTEQAFKNLSQAASARNLNLDDTQGAFRAIEQMFSKGKVQAEELRGQLAERLPGAVAIFARASNISLAELDKNLEKGAVGLDFVVRGLEAYARQFDGQMDVITERLSAYINRAQNAYNDWLRGFMDSKSQEALKNALGSLTEFLNSEAGKQFADELGSALAEVIKAFQWAAENADTLYAILKGFLALQAAKFFVDMSTGVLDTTKKLGAFRTAIVAAASGTGAMATAARALTPLLGPLGAAVAAVTLSIAAYSRGVQEADKHTRNLISVMRQAQGVKTLDDVAQAERAQAEQLRNSEERLRKLVQLRDAANNPLSTLDPRNAVETARNMLGTDTYTRGEVDAAITAEMQQQEALQISANNLQRRKNTLLAEEAQRQKEAADALREANANIPTLGGGGDGGKTPKAPRGPDPESVRDRLLKMTEDLRSKLAAVEVDANARTAEQVEQNFQLAIQRIGSEVTKAQIDLDRLQRDAAKSNRGQGTELTTELTTARGALDAYAEAAREAAELERATAMVALHEARISELVSDRDAELQLVNTLQEQGAITVGQAWLQNQQITSEYNQQLQTETEALIAFLQSIPEESRLYNAIGVPETLRQVRQVKAETVAAQSTARQVGMQLAPQIAAGTANALTTLGQGLAGLVQGANSLGDAFKGAMDAFRTFAADFLVQIGQMILQAIILQAIQNALSGGSGGYMGAIKGAFGVKHNGGIAGRSDNGNGTRTVSPLVFAGAQRFHDGGLPGLKPNEVPTILEKGEEVLTADDPRHVANGGSAGAAPVNVQNNIMFDSASVVADGMARPEGRKAFLTFIQANKGAVKAALG